MYRTFYFSFILFFSVVVSAQDVIFTVSGELNDEKVALNSISFENISNGSFSMFDSLPDVTDYQINLTKNSYGGATGIGILDNPSRFAVTQNTPGKLVVQYNSNQTSDIRISVYSINGQKVHSWGKRSLQERNAITVEIGTSNLFLVKFETNTASQTFKVLGSENVNDYRLQISDGGHVNRVKSSTAVTADDFSFSVGDSIRISAFKSGYYAPPVDLVVGQSQSVNFVFEESENINFVKINGDEYALSDGLISHFGEFKENGVNNISMYLFAPEHNINLETLEATGSGALVYFDMFNTSAEIENGVYNIRLPELMNTDTIYGETDINNDGLINEDDYYITLPDGSFYISTNSLYSSNTDIQHFTGHGFQSGKVILTKDGDVFTLEFDGIGENGDTISGFYSGLFYFYDVLAGDNDLTINVIDGDTWSPDNPFGDDAANATVKLLDSDNPDKNAPLYEGTTNSNGSIVFSQILSGNYFVYIEKGNQSNVLQKEVFNGKQIGYIVGGLFRSQAEVDQAVTLPETTVGDPKIVDINADGIINNNDKTYGYQITVENNASYNFFIFSEEPSSVMTEAAINDTLLWCYSKLHEYIEFSYLFDAVYSNTVNAPDNSWNEIEQHTQDSYNSKIQTLWTDAYDIIYKVNLILKNAEDAISNTDTRNTLIAQAKGIRAYLYYNLLIWFDELPIETGTSESFIPRNSTADVLAQIEQDAAEAAHYLPASWTEDNFRLSKSFAKGLQARILLYEKKYSDAFSPALEVINSGMYTLSPDTTNFTSSNTEMFCGFEKGDNTVFNDFFTKGSFVPVMRYTELILIYAEALLNYNNTASAIDFFNQLMPRRDNPVVTTLTIDDIFNQWLTELSKEGNIFAALKRFDKALEVVNDNPRNLLLPIPMSVLNTNPNIYQNAGY